MEILNTALNIVLVALSVLLIVVVMLQKTKSSGLGAAFGGETASFSSRGKSASREAKLQKITVILGIAIALLAIAILVLSQFVDAKAPEATSFLNTIIK